MQLYSAEHKLELATYAYILSGLFQSTVYLSRHKYWVLKYTNGAIFLHKTIEAQKQSTKRCVTNTMFSTIV